MCFLFRKNIRKKQSEVNLPLDIVREIKRKFSNRDIESVLELCQKVRYDSLNVGADQLIRCMILLSEGDRGKMEEIRERKYWGDPRDVISSANDKFKNCNSGLRKFD